MTLSVTHQKVSGKSNGPDPTLVQPTDWNATHTLVAQAMSILGNNTSGVGPVLDLTAAQAAAVIGALIAANAFSEIAALGSTVQTTARGNIGIHDTIVQVGGSPPTLAVGQICVIL